MSSTAVGQQISLEQLAALNDEIASLVRAGVPLEVGLGQFGGDRRDAPERVGQWLAERLQRGQSLAEALDAQTGPFPPVYCAVVKAGLRSGRLASALEALSTYARALLDLRRRIGLALMYPVFVLLLAYGLFLVFLLEMLLRLRHLYETFRISPPQALQWTTSLRDWAAAWSWIPPLMLLALFGYWLLTGQAGLIGLRGLSRPIGWIPGMKSIARNYRCANFADLLAMLVDHAVPLNEAVVLAADAAGDDRLQHTARSLAQQVERGEALPMPPPRDSGFPPFLQWLLVHGQRHGSLAGSLFLAGQRYRQRAVEQIEWFKVVFPLAAGLIIGGTVTALYALSLFVPVATLLRSLAGEGNPL